MSNLNGYRNIYMPSHPLATTHGMVYEHVLVAEEKMKRPLKKGEVVHHIDHVRNNNVPENLLVFSSRSDHAAFHIYGEYYLDSEGIAHCNKRRIKVCLECGENISSKAKLCEKCSKFKRRYSQRPSRNELKQLIRTKSFVEIGKMYNVSDNAIKKWCLSMDLPKTKKEINQINDLEWEKI